ncbi:hypothetical protein D8M04_03495 [Oceanobacillus piezotolerans]|uniref:Lipoprotein n=1 Tax=Oceanobacillus piezotolerans TaxID=2448030 RepID=A0A498DBF5_9BACI|nr:hypothetical protein [Oceanobacillus piezotolerans]RLL48341.1 hypothetical protein D8M04_03495 [Oceanobacillus piezotolerans]
MKKQWQSFYVVTFITIILLVLVACNEKTETKYQDENLVTIETVLNQAFTGPSDELKQIVDSKGLEDLVQYDENFYKDYFADESSYLEFVKNNYGSGFMIEPIRNGYELKVNNIEYEKTESNEIIYNFAVEIQYRKEGSKKSAVEVVKGQANLNKEHKIEDLLIHDKEFHSLFNN